LDTIVPACSLGLSYGVAPAITPGSGPGHLSLFGYDPVRHRIGRGALEALGIGLELDPDDVAFRGNFAVRDDEGRIADRRAGRMSTEENRQLVDVLREKLEECDGCRFTVTSGRGHRFVLVLGGEGLSDRVSDSDPHATGVPPAAIEPTDGSPEAERTARCARACVAHFEAVLRETTDAPHTCILRGAAKRPSLRSLRDRFGVASAAACSYPMYRGLARAAGMDVGELEGDDDVYDRFDEAWRDHDFVFLHVKATDVAGEDGNDEEKTRAIERFDERLPALIERGPSALVITGDHSSPCTMKSHSWHPSPFLLSSKRASPDGFPRFAERYCRAGSLGRFSALQAMPLMLACAGRLAKFGP
jgi:2,3-bisphosphoglycerate-independent phosphoglycerate mutase